MPEDILLPVTMQINMLMLVSECVSGQTDRLLPFLPWDPSIQWVLVLLEGPERQNKTVFKINSSRSANLQYSFIKIL